MIPRVIQVIPYEDFTVDVYFDDGKIVTYNPKDRLSEYGFNRIKDIFLTRCTVMNGTLAWDISGDYDEKKCFDIDPIVLHELPAIMERISA